MIVNTNKLLIKARKGKYALPHFNVSNLETMQAVVNVCNKLKSPAIIATSESAIKYAGIENLAASIIMQCHCEGPPPTPLQTIQIRYGVGIKSVYDQDIPTRGVIGGSNRISSSVRSASVSQSGGGENFKYIVNPNTNEKHLIDSEEGQKLFEIYQKLKK